MSISSCPCGNSLSYAACCARYHAGPLRLQAPDAAALMRSRYSAFVTDETDYLLATGTPARAPNRWSPTRPACAGSAWN